MINATPTPQSLAHAMNVSNPVAPAPIYRPSEVITQLVHRSARLLLGLLDHLQHGSLHIVLPDGTLVRCGHGEPQATLHLSNWQVCEAVLKRGDIGFAESYMAGEWTTDDLARLLDVLILNRRALETAIYGTWWGSLYSRLKHWLQGNTRQQARKNIQAHYDLGNDFYRLWLDPSMTYSSALFGAAGAEDAHDLEAAQLAKYQRALNELQLPANASLLEVGSGWGGFAELAATSGAQVVGLTLSTEQQRYARERLARRGLADQTEFRLQDYRDTTGQFDGIVSIEMFEAVGEEYWPSYFQALWRNLKPGCRALVQTITIDESLFERYRRSTDFIQQYIFPGGMLPAPQKFVEHAQAAGFQIVQQFAFGQDYARTLALWRQSFMAQTEMVQAHGYDTRFIRMWEFYLAYCESAFRQENTNVYQYTLLKPNA